jgi:Ulp1 family protease
MYANMCMDRAKKYPGKFPKIHVFNSFFYDNISSGGYQKVRRWGKKVIYIGLI